jgi:hypothetical protein
MRVSIYFMCVFAIFYRHSAVFADIYSMPWNGFYSFRWLSPGKGAAQFVL